MIQEPVSRRLIFVLVLVCLIAVLIVLQLGLRPVAAKLIEPAIVNFAGTVLGKPVGVAQHWRPANPAVPELIKLTSGDFVCRLLGPAYRGLIQFWVVYGPTFKPIALSFPYNAAWQTVTRPSDLAAVAGASIDVRLIQKALAVGQKFLSQYKEL